MKNLKNLYKSFNDLPLHEQEEKKEKFQAFANAFPQDGNVSNVKTEPTGETKEVEVEIEIPGVEGKQEVKIKHKDVMTDEALKGVTITFGHEGDDVEQYTDVDFDAGEMIQDHENEGQDWIFIAEGDGSMTFEVEVQVEASYQESGNIQQIDWETLTVIFSDEGEPLDEKEKDPPGHWKWKEKLKRLFGIDEGTCGYGVDGELGDEPAGPNLMISLQERFQKLANIKKKR